MVQANSTDYWLNFSRGKVYNQGQHRVILDSPNTTVREFTVLSRAPFTNMTKVTQPPLGAQASSPFANGLTLPLKTNARE
jgi:hypothetical protein